MNPKFPARRPALRFGTPFTVAVLGIQAACASGDPGSATGSPGADFQRAEELSPRRVRSLIYGTTYREDSGDSVASVIVRPNWIGGGPEFWYEFRTPAGFEYYRVDPETRSREALFDAARLAARLTGALGRPVDWRRDSLGQLAVDAAADRLSFRMDGRLFDYDRVTDTLSAAEPPAADLAAFEHSVSPDGRYAVFVRDHDLYVRDLASGKNRRLSDDGTRWHSFGLDHGVRDSQKHLALHSSWLPGSRRFWVERWDNRQVGDLWLVDWLSDPRPTLREIKYAMPGETAVPEQELWVFDIETASAVDVSGDKWPGQFVGHMDLDPGGIFPQRHSDDRLYFTRMKRGYDVIELVVADTRTGETSVLLEEQSLPYFTIRVPRAELVDDGDEVLWLSDRSGWNHFYRYDAEGRLLNAVTGGEFTVEDIAHLDSTNGVLFFSAFGREADVYPFFRQYYRVNLDGSDVQRLTPEDALHRAYFSPDGGYFVDNHSRADAPPVARLRDAAGRLVMELGTLDTSGLAGAGYEHPEYFSVKAADGRTDLYGLMWRPAGFDPEVRYPLISIVQPNPGVSGLRYDFRPDHPAVSLAAMGFVVVDARTRGQSRHVRSREFLLHSYGDARDYPLADAHATIEQLAERHLFIDRDRVGVTGHSGGGFMSSALILTYPELFKVAVSTAGNHENNVYEQNSSEYHWGVTQDTVGGWSADFSGNSGLAANLQGKLLLVHGDNDRDVHVGHTLRLARALQQAGKRFDMMIFPGEDHGLDGVAGYYERLRQAYFAEHLLGDDRVPTDLD